jgi:hypothetical protein
VAIALYIETIYLCVVVYTFLAVKCVSWVMSDNRGRGLHGTCWRTEKAT